MFALRRQSAPQDEVPFDGLKSYDSLIIRTENSQYRFELLDPSDRRGILSGGHLGDEAHEAVFLSVIGDREDIDHEKIKKNTKAIFFLLQQGRGPKHLVTSRITAIKLVRLR